MAQDPATKIANDALAPILAEYERQKAEEQKRAANARVTATQGAAGLAQILGGIAPQTQATYKQAGDSTSAYAKGFSAAFQQWSEQTASDLNKFLSAQGGPQQGTTGPGSIDPAVSPSNTGSMSPAMAQQRFMAGQGGSNNY